jgi:prophage regulatory protein
MPATAPAQIERLPAVLARTGLSRSAAYLAIAQGAFPKQVKLSTRAVGFLAAEVDAWIAERAARRSSSPSS